MSWLAYANFPIKTQQYYADIYVDQNDDTLVFLFLYKWHLCHIL